MKYKFDYPSKQELEKIPFLKIEEEGNCNGLQAKSYKIERFTELVYLISLLRIHNKKYFVLYRGESKQHLNSEDVLSFLPTIYRSKDKVDENLQNLRQKTKELLKFEEMRNIQKNKTIIAHSLLQHYEITPTPFLDLTQSLRVAYSIALNDAQKKKRKAVYLYLFALPFTNGYITNRDDLTLVNLMSLCPSNVLRPHLQEGFVIKHKENIDFNRYLIAEIKIDSKDLSCNKKFAIIDSHSMLFNINDEFAKKTNELK